MTVSPVSIPPYTLSTSARKDENFLMHALHAVDSYTKPRGDTEGNLGRHSYFLGCSISDGLAVMGAKGLLGSIVAPAFGVFVANKTGKPALGIIAGTGMAVALGAGIALATGSPILTTAVFSGLLGAYETFRGSTQSATRDAASGANILSAPFISGPLKLASGIGAALGTKVESKLGKALIGGVAAASVGAIVAGLGLSPVSIPVAVAAGFFAGALGPFFGPRFSQLFRNLANDIGIGIGKLEKKLGIENNTDSSTLNIIGAIPASLIKEGLRTYALSDGKPFNTLFGCAGEAFKQSYIFMKQITSKEKRKLNPQLEIPMHLVID